MAKEFIVNLKIGTKEAEAQVRASADNIKKMLNNALKDGVGGKELENIANKINSLFTKVGQSAPIDLEGELFGDGKLEDRIKILSDSLDGLLVALDKVGSSGNKLSADVQKQITALEQQVKQTKELKQELKSAMKDVDQFKATERVDGWAKTGEEASQLVNTYRELKKYINDVGADKSSLEYQQKLIKYMQTSAKIAGSWEQYKDTMEWPTFRTPDDRKAFTSVAKEASAYINKEVNEQLTTSISDSLDNIAKNANSQITKVKTDSSSIEVQKPINADQINENKKLSVSYEELKSKAIELKNAYQQLDKALEDDGDTSDAENRIKTLSDYFVALDETGKKKKEITNILGDLEFDDIDTDAVLGNLCNTLQIEVPQAVQVAKSSIESIDDNKVEIGSLVDQLQTIRSMGKGSQNEFGFTINADGANYVIESAKDIVKVSEEASVAVRSLNDNLTILGHTHPSGDGAFSPGDYRSAISQKRSGMNAPMVVVGDKIASMLNLDGVSDDILKQIEEKLSKYKNNDDPISAKTFGEIQNILSTNGFSKALQTFNISNDMNGFAQALYEVSLNASNAQSPLEKLQSLISYYSGNKLNANNIDNFTEQWKEFENGAKSAAKVFDIVMQKVGATDLEGNVFNTSSKQKQDLNESLKMIVPGVGGDNTTSTLQQTGNAAQEAEVKVKSFLDLSKELQGRYTFEDVEIGQLLSQLDVAKNELQELANNGVIAEQQMREVSDAFNTTTEHLNDRLTANKNDREKEIQYYVDSERQTAERAALDVKDAEDRAYEAELDSLRYQEAAGRLLDEKFNIERENENLREQLAQQKQTEGQNQEELSTLKSENEELREQLSLLDQLKIKATQYSDVRSFMRENVSDLKDAGVKGAKSAKEFWRDANYNREDFQPVAMAMYDVANIIRTKVPDSILDGWFRNADSAYKSKLENLALTDTDIRNAALNVMWENYKQYSGKDIGYDEFLHSEIPVYRGKNSEKYVDGDELLSFTFDRSMAEKFGNHVFEAMIKPIDTIGAYQTTAESEILVRRDQLEAMSGFSKWLSNMSSDLDKSFVQANVDADNLSTINAENDALREQASLKEQIASADTTDTSNVPTIEAENDALREKVALQDKINESQDTEVKQKKTSKKTIEQKVDEDARKVDIRKLNGEINKAIKGLDFNISATNLEGQQKEIQDAYRDASAQVKEFAATVEDSEQVEISSIQAVVDALSKKTTAYKDQVKVHKEQIKAQEQEEKKNKQKSKNFGSSVEIREIARFNKLNQLATDPLSRYSKSSTFMDAFNDYKSAYDQLIAKKRDFEASDDVTKEDEVKFRQLTDECTKYAKALEKAVAASEKLEKDGSNATPLGEDFINSNTGRKKALTDFAKQMHDVNAASLTFDKNFTKCMFTVKNNDGTFTKMTAQVDAFKNQIIETTGVTKRSTTVIEGFLNDLKSKASSILTYVISITGIEEVFQQVRKGIEYVKEIDSALTELKKVTNESSASYDSFLQSMSKTASVVGSTVSELTTMASEWARLGYTMEEAGKLAESTAVLLNVSEFEDATTASEALISTMQAFQYTADESQHVVDILNEVGNNYAVSSDGIAVALQDSASALMEAGNNLEQSVALVAAANKVVKFVPRCHSNMVT